MEVNGSRGILRKESQEKSVKGRIYQKKKESHAGSVKHGKHPKRRMPYLLAQTKFGASDTAFFRFARRPWRLAPFMGRAVTDGFPLRHNEQRKKKIGWNPVKAPLRHKHKRNGSCVICLKRYSFVQAWRKALFSAYAVVGTRLCETRFRAMVFRRINPLLRKILCVGNKKATD